MVCGGGTLDDPSLPESSAGPTIRPNLAHQSAQRARQGRTDVSARPRLLSSGLRETNSFSGRFLVAKQLYRLSCLKKKSSFLSVIE